MRRTTRAARLTAFAVAAAATLAACGPVASREAGQPEIKIGLITKTEANPYFVAMRQSAQAMAAARSATLITAAGRFTGDNASQVTAIENMVKAGVKGILITPNDATAIVPSIRKARAAGVLVIALDTPTKPQNATDALLGTDNFKAGQLIGMYAKDMMGDRPAKVAMLDAAPESSTSRLRHAGFLKGFGIAEGDPSIVCSTYSYGDQTLGRIVMRDCLRAAPDLNVVYTVNEPTAFGAHAALKARGVEKHVIVVSVDGGCAGVRAVEIGQIAATSQQSPLKMAEMGVQAVVEYAESGVKASGFTDTGVKLITNKPVAGLASKNTSFGRQFCWD
ncbi:substrate-binding domain-containing protein [Nonomuraea roseoviolacea]|uniref:Fructose transport system substrate-binding protein n=1 Tax=Nonomuraea roseoviolacea subsp. carminata TaxID=160689 RepID=A0ABT1JTL8_9ACTN|nr:substrate-binding domain-containing protein [Nonomuraea roseoviolacea]MCP2345098.1 fructose transport system substrate-binding protein [Nonomuraea roseoviolacea subsp. carminata]